MAMPMLSIANTTPETGTLLVELSGSPVNAEQLRAAADLLEKEEAALRKVRAIYQAAASNLLVDPALEDDAEWFGVLAANGG